MTRETLRVRLPGSDGLWLEKQPEGGFSWTLATSDQLGLAPVVQRAASRLREAEDAIELWDYWLSHGSEGSPGLQDKLLDSRIAYSAERRLLKEFLAWAEAQNR